MYNYNVYIWHDDHKDEDYIYMEASIVDLRYKTKDVLQSLERNETVKIYYRGKLKGIIQPATTKSKKKTKKRFKTMLFLEY